MSILLLTMSQALILGIGFGIGFFFNKVNIKPWRVFLGLLSGFAISWSIGVIMWAYIASFLNPNADIPSIVIDGISRFFLFSVIGASVGVYYGRQKAKQQNLKQI
ncbi:hypothetical protein [Nitrosomonas sp. Nm34]|uniref:hypothetical protein n=1 Tax=Nitrosomonas sp. Nm34 TaxID=1881055 RepID=UPI0008EADA19|nr:hypothetical protein [Nitrosomonas sp. Nm34]SFI39640.1 hypothetical protein SAMN05428978_100855 [Nitrosomonas sp. Nm34]